MKFIPTAITQKFGRQLLQAQKHSPRAMFIGGIVGVGVATVLACRATLKLEETLEEFHDDVDQVRGLKGEVDNGERSNSSYQRDVMYVYAKGTISVVKLYAPSMIIGSLSLAALTGSHITLSRRNASLTAAYAAVQSSFDAYRERVKAELGEEKEKDIRYGVVEKDNIVNGKNKPIKVVDVNGLSPYARFFEESNPNFKKNAELNRLFIQSVQNYLNHLLQARGHVFLNEAYEALGMEHSSAGAVVGWKIGEHGDNYIDFGLFDSASAEFINGYEPVVILDFNVDGVMYDKI